MPLNNEQISYQIVKQLFDNKGGTNSEITVFHYGDKPK